MNPTEIMIGDWVCVTKNFTQKYHRIRALSKDKECVLRGTYTNNYGVECPSAFSINDVEPILLTPEILKKSGFEHCISQEDSDNFDGKQGGLCYVFNKTEDGYISCIDVTYSFTITGRIKYVHELQHILRLCGIEKEIVL